MRGICRERFEAFGTAGMASKIKVLSLERCSKDTKLGNSIPNSKLSCNMKLFEWLSLDAWRQHEAWWALYLQAFPEDERDRFEQIEQALGAGLALAGRYPNEGPCKLWR